MSGPACPRRCRNTRPVPGRTGQAGATPRRPRRACRRGCGKECGRISGPAGRSRPRPRTAPALPVHALTGPEVRTSRPPENPVSMHLHTYVTELALAAEPRLSQFRYYQGASHGQAGLGPRPVRRGGGGRRFLGPVHALPATPTRAVGEGLRLGGRCRRDVVLEPLSRGSL